MTDVKAHEELFAADGNMAVGDGYVELHFPMGGKRFVFQASGAERVDGIDYTSFKIRSVWVGQNRQWTGGGFTGDTLWPATDLFEKWDVPMDAVQTGLSITIQLRNESDKPQPFAVKFVGRIVE